MQYAKRIKEVIQRLSDQPAYSGIDWPELPLNGKILEPVIGRQHVVSVDHPRKSSDGKELPSAAVKNYRSQPGEIWQTTGVHMKVQAVVLGLLIHDVRIPYIKMRLREDIGKDVYKARKDAGMPLEDGFLAETGFRHVDSYLRTVAPEYSYTFMPGEVIDVEFSAAVAFLINPWIGQFVEEVADMPKPKLKPKPKRGRPKKKASEPVAIGA